MAYTALALTQSVFTHMFFHFKLCAVKCSEVLQSSSSLSSSLSEKGLLQLLFDVRFLSDALAGGKPLNETPGSTQPSRY